MRKKQLAFSAVGCLGIGLLILDSKTALLGAAEGAALSISTLVPSLFPFLFLSILLTTSFRGIPTGFLAPVGRLLRIPAGAEILLVSSFLGGYPAGAQAVYEAYHAGQLSKENAEKMLSFCNNAGPSFLFGMASVFFTRGRTVWALWGFHILGALAAAWLFPCGDAGHIKPPDGNDIFITAVLKKAITAMAVICGWVIIFRVVISFADRWFLWAVPREVRTGIIGLLDLSNGICELGSIADERLRFFLCSGMLSLGGICVTLQTASVTEGLSKAYYYRGKGVQAFVSLSCSAGLMYHPLFLLALLCLIPFRFFKIESRNPARVVV